MSSLHEECGVFGIYSPSDTDVARLAYYGLYALQHRGQEGCGIAVARAGDFSLFKDVGLVSDVFSDRTLDGLGRGNIAVAHVRYGTTGGSSRANCQPVLQNRLDGGLVLAHNGNLTNAAPLRAALEARGAVFQGTSDTEIIAYEITHERLRCASTEEAVASVMSGLEGAYSLVLMTPSKLIVARDPRGFRPLCYGRMPDGTIVAASESCALDAVGAQFVRDVDPGEVVAFSSGGARSLRGGSPSPRSMCVFEYIYFARPDSVLDGVSVHTARRDMGRRLAYEHPAAADLVVGVPDSGIDAALGFAEHSGIPYGIGFIKNKYIGRTFIAPHQSERENGVRIKLNPVSEAVRGKRIVLVDDSIVRGTTTARTVRLLRAAGAREIHMRVSAPPFIAPCFYGTDVDARENLIANKHSVAEIAAIIGVDSLGYISLDGLDGLLPGGCCAGCFTGEYPTPVPSENSKLSLERSASSPRE